MPFFCKSNSLVPACLVLLAICCASTCSGSELRKVEVSESIAQEASSLDIGDLIASGAVQPASEIGIDAGKDGWVLRTPNGPERLRWYKNLLNAGPKAGDLTIDPKQAGVFDIYVQARAVNGDPQDALPMAFEIRMDDGSRREVVGAKGFVDHHYDLEILACRAWPMDGRKLILHSLGKPVYLYGFRFEPAAGTSPAVSSRRVARWLATDHVAIVREPDRHFAFPGVALLKNGDLAVVYREGSVHAVEPTGKISLSRSTDGGRHWQPRVVAMDRPDVDDRDPSIFQMADGTTLLFSADCVSTSRDNGLTWSQPLDTPVFGPKGGVEDEDGAIVYGGLRRVVQSHFTEIHGRTATLQAVAAYRSRDLGKSWTEVGKATHTLYLEGPMDFIWYDEPFMCVMPRKCWVFAARVDLDGYARIIRSTDRGQTWEPIIKTPVWGFPQHLLPLRDGRLLMTYGYRRPPWGIRACLSGDQGKTWDLENEIVLRMDGGTPDGQPRKVIDGDLGYPVSVQLADGSIFTVYYHNAAGSNCFVAGTFWQLPSDAGLPRLSR